MILIFTLCVLIGLIPGTVINGFLSVSPPTSNGTTNNLCCRRFEAINNFGQQTTPSLPFNGVKGFIRIERNLV